MCRIRPKESSRKFQKVLKYIPIVRDISEKLNLDPDILTALIMTESTGKTCAMRFEPQWRWHTPAEHMMAYAEKLGCSVETEKNGQATSWGLLQVMGTVSRELGHRGWFSELCDPIIGIKYGALHFKRMFQREGSLPRAVSAYNAGSARLTPGGLFENQRYVDKVMGLYRQLKNI